jgi:hypothetical protein
MAKAEKDATPKKTFKVSIEIKGESSTIIRENLPFICDKTDKSLEWLASKGYKEEEIEVIGNKPSNWTEFFKQPEQVVV